MFTGSLPRAKVSFLEYYFWSLGFNFIAGLDEAGRGALAGPLYVGLVIFPKGYFNQDIKDSKQLSPSKREKLYNVITQEAVEYAISWADVEEINSLGLTKALQLAMERAISSLKTPIDLLLIDGRMVLRNYRGPQKAIIKGDSLCLSIAGGSILAKVTRDRVMEELDRLYPEYGFSEHKGYATERHLQILKKLGPSPVHRLNFKPCMER